MIYFLLFKDDKIEKKDREKYLELVSDNTKWKKRDMTLYVPQFIHLRNVPRDPGSADLRTRAFLIRKFDDKYLTTLSSFI